MAAAPPPPDYPIDKYLRLVTPQVELSTILGEADWSAEPTIRPEDELMLKRLHGMLQSTAEELRELSYDLRRNKVPSVQVKTKPTVLDEEFNEKMHLKEVVEAKFNGRVLVDADKNNLVHSQIIKEKLIQKIPKTEIVEKKNKVNAGVQVNLTVRPAEQLSKTKIKKINTTTKSFVETNTPIHKTEVIQYRPKKNYVAYEECKSDLIYEAPPKAPTHKLVVQEMPAVNIRSELQERKLLNLDILPSEHENKPPATTQNASVIEISHEALKPAASKTSDKIFEPVRKVVKLHSCESSESILKSNSETEDASVRIKSKQIKTQLQRTFYAKSQLSNRAKLQERQRKVSIRDDTSRKPNVMPSLGSEGWKRKLNSIYAKPSTSKVKTGSGLKNKDKQSINQRYPIKNKTSIIKHNNILNNADYIPYSKLTLGGANVSDIEVELGPIQNKADIPLFPIVDKILSSQENSVQESPRKQINNMNSLSISEEKLFKEVLDIDKKIKKTLNKDTKNKNTATMKSDNRSVHDVTDNDNYSDDFDDEQDENLEHLQSSNNNSHSEKHENSEALVHINQDLEKIQNINKTQQIKNHEKHKSHIKTLNLSVKNVVDVFEFVHSVDTQDTATQSQTIQKISLKETQTSPRNEESVSNRVCISAFDTSGEIDTMFKLEKDFIKNMIIEEYGDVFELTKNITKPSTSANVTVENKNMSSHAKDTQTSPSKAKSVMTSPRKTATRTTSPMRGASTVHRQMSPKVAPNFECSIQRSESEPDEAGITVNLSSPRFKLRLPQSSRDIFSNLDSAASSSGERPRHRLSKKSERKFSSSESYHESESDLSSLGEINWRLKTEIRKRNRFGTTSESSTTSVNPSSVDPSENVVPAKSEGEVSVGQFDGAEV